MRNPDLHARLVAACRLGPQYGLGGERIIVASSGQPLQGHYVADPLRPGGVKLVLSHFGETYRVCCPWCGDVRHRLWISHAWGIYDPRTKTRNYHLYKCFNEDCTKDPGFFTDFRQRIDRDTNRMFGGMARPTLTVTPTESTGPVEVPAPGELIALRSLPEGHPALKFLASRNLNPNKLETYFQVAWCEQSNLPRARHRLIVPIVMHGLRVGWQARYVDLAGSGDCKNVYMCSNQLCQYQWLHSGPDKPARCVNCQFAERPPDKVVKWYTGPGTKVSQCLLNYDVASSYEFAVVTEGAFDVFRLGSPSKTEVPGPGIAAFNHKLSPQHVALIKSRWERLGTVYLMFDDDVWDCSCEQLLRLEALMGRGRAVIVPLDPGKDPADMEHGELWERIRKAGKLQKANCIP